jgi:hypothetical protein
MVPSTSHMIPILSFAISVRSILYYPSIYTYVFQVDSSIQVFQLYCILISHLRATFSVHLILLVSAITLITFYDECRYEALRYTIFTSLALFIPS